MRWPFGVGPPHMTLKPSKKNKKTPKHKKNQKRKKDKKNPKILKNELFSYQSKFYSFLGGCPNFPFFDNLALKARTLKHYKNRGFRKLLKKSVTKRPFLDKKPKSRNSSYHLFLPIFFSFNNKKHKHLLSKPKKRKFSKFKLKTLKIEKPNFCTLFLKKTISRKLPDNWARKKHTKW